MAGFYPHVGVSPGGFTPLPIVAVTAVLDSLLTDLGAGVNGWTLYDDMRVSGTGSPLYPEIYTPYGQFMNTDHWHNNSYDWQFTTGSQLTWGYTLGGFNYYYAISGVSSSKTPISVDLTNWYDAYWSSWPNNYPTATLDRNYTGATGRTKRVYQKLTKWCVLQCSSSQKTFYLQIGQMTERAGAPVLYLRPWETWNSGTHSGTNGGAMEHIRFYFEGSIELSAPAAYTAWFLQDVFALSTTGPPAVGYGTPAYNLYYVGNLDTSGCYAGDTDALCVITGDTTLSGYHKAPTPDYYLGYASYNSTLTTINKMFGAVQCLRTMNGDLWSMPTGFGTGLSARNQYQIYPRGRWNNMCFDMPSADNRGVVTALDIDLYHMSSPIEPKTTEGRRGKLRYIKASIHPSPWQYGVTVGPFNDGFSYMYVRTSQIFYGGLYSTPAPASSWEAFVQGQTNARYYACGWTFGPKVGSYSNGLGVGDIYGGQVSTDANYGYTLMHVLMPVI